MGMYVCMYEYKMQIKLALYEVKNKGNPHLYLFSNVIIMFTIDNSATFCSFSICLFLCTFDYCYSQCHRTLM